MAFDAEEWIQNTFFSLHHIYDPVKAKAYYERTKKLKGRKPGKGEVVSDTSSKLPDWVTDTPEVEDTRNHIDNAQKTPSDAGKLREAATKRQAQLRARLERLETILAELVEKAARSAGAETKDSKETASKTEESKKTDTAKEKEKPKTASEKKEAAKKAAEDYEKNKKAESNESDQAVQDKIEEVQAKIAAARESLRKAIERAKAMKPPAKSGSTTTSPAKTPPKKATSGLSLQSIKTASAVATPKKGERQNGS